MSDTDSARKEAEQIIKSAVEEQRIMLEAGGYGGSNTLILQHLTIDILPRLLTDALTKRDARIAELTDRAFRWMKLEENSQQKIEALEKSLRLENEKKIFFAEKLRSVEDELLIKAQKIASLVAEIESLKKTLEEWRQDAHAYRDECVSVKQENGRLLDLLKDIRNDNVHALDPVTKECVRGCSDIDDLPCVKDVIDAALQAGSGQDVKFSFGNTKPPKESGDGK